MQAWGMFRLVLFTLALILTVSPAFAENVGGPLHSLGSFGNGLAITIVPANLLAALAVGIWAQQLGARAVLLVPVGFIFFALIGAGLTATGIDLPLNRLAPPLTVIILGLLIASNARFAAVIAGASAGVVGLYHGVFAMDYFLNPPRLSSAFLFWPGFALGNLILTSAGIGMVAISAHSKSDRPIRLLGAFILLSGLILVIRLVDSGGSLASINR